MPIMGRPIDSNNKFSGVTMAPKKDSSSDILRKISGKEVSDRGVKFVDRDKHGKMGKDDFLKLLTHQLENQDPENPMDQRKFAADLAQFSQLEQLSSMNSKMAKMDVNKIAESKYYAASFLGKKVYTQGSSIEFTGEPANVPIFLERPAKEVRVRVFDKSGSMVAEFTEEAVGKGQQNLEWDGKRLDKYSAAHGLYKFSVDAWDENFQKINVKTSSSGLVKSVTFDNGSPVFTLEDGKNVALRDISKFEVPSALDVAATRKQFQAKQQFSPQAYRDSVINSNLKEY